MISMMLHAGNKVQVAIIAQKNAFCNEATYSGSIPKESILFFRENSRISWETVDILLSRYKYKYFK